MSLLGVPMSNDHSNFDRRPGGVDPTMRRASNGTLYLTLGGSALLAALLGGLVVYELMTPRTAAPDIVASIPAAAPASLPAQPSSAPAPAAAPVSWTNVATYGSWQVRCQNGSAPKKLCTAVLEVIDKQSKNVLMAWIVGPDSKGALQAVFQTPTGVRVGSGIDVKLGAGEARHVNYLSCVTQQCTAAAPMDDAFVKEATGSAKATVTLYAADGKSLDFGIPVNGLDKAIAAIRK